MKKYNVELLAPAWIDLDKIADYHMNEVGVISAQKITSKILNSLERLKSFPLSCPLVPHNELAEQGYRMMSCEKYACFYKLLGDTVFVYHITPASVNYPALFNL